MKITLAGRNSGPVASAVRAQLLRRGYEVGDGGVCSIFFPGGVGDEAALRQLAANSSITRLVLRSHAYAYGSSTKNPGLLTEDRVSLLPAKAPEQRWLKLEAIASTHPNYAAVRLTNVLAPEEGDLIVGKLAGGASVALAGHDPSVQFIGVDDAASALVAAAEGRVTGIFNAAGEGTIPLKKAFRAAGSRRIPVLKPMLGPSAEQMQYNWTVSSDRARRELGWQPARSTVEAFADFVKSKPNAQPALLAKPYDDWGLDLDYVNAWGAWFSFLRNVYWRIEHEGMDNIPAEGRALFVSNHRGFMPLDAVMHLSLILTHRHRVPRFLIINILLRTPFMCNFLTKLGGVIASQENAARLFAKESLVAIFPEGIRGTFTPYKETHKLRDFSKSGFAKMAIENGAPVVPAAVVGHAEIFPIIGRINSSLVVRELGWPYLPIAPMFPLAPIPLPSKWHVRVLPPVPLQGLKPADAESRKIVRDFSAHIQDLLQRHIDEMVHRRKHIFWGDIFHASAPLSRVAGGSGD